MFKNIFYFKTFFILYIVYSLLVFNVNNKIHE